MSVHSFPCPACGQPVTFDSASAGDGTICPSCRRLVTIPQSYVTAGALSPFSPAARPAPARTSGVAIASFICSLFLCVGCLPGIICGHLARRDLRRDPSLGGSGFAIAGLIISYLSLTIMLGCALFFAVCMSSPEFRKGFRDGFVEAERRHAASTSYNSVDDSTNATASPAVTADPLWNLNLTAADFPDHPAAGKVHGQEFTVESATAEGGTITLREGTGGFGDRAVIITTFATNSESLAGKNYDISSANPDLSHGSAPHVRLAWKEAGARAAMRIKPFTSGYALKLQLGTADADGKIPGKIYLCFPDDEKSYVAGSFDLETKKAPARKKQAKTPAAN